MRDGGSPPRPRPHPTLRADPRDEPVGRDRRRAIAGALGLVGPLEQLLERRWIAIHEPPVALHLRREADEPQGTAGGDGQRRERDEEGHPPGPPGCTGNAVSGHRPTGPRLPPSPPR